MRRGLVVIAVVAWLALGALPASAATVSVRESYEGTGDLILLTHTVVIAAAPGETNAVAVTAAEDGTSAIVTDAGAALQPEAPCTSEPGGAVRCPTPRKLIEVAATLGDGDDTLTVASNPGELVTVEADGEAGADRLTTVETRDTLDGGTGDDIITSGDAGDQLVGGSGTDTLTAGGGDDHLADGDDPAAPGDDTLDGGAGDDVADYGGRIQPVTVDLSDTLPDGQDGEGDRLSAVEAARGGAGADTLAGDDGANELIGNGGDDVIGGGAGDDRLFGSDGRDRLDGGTGADDVAGGAGLDASACGSDADIVEDPDTDRPVDSSCERVRLRSATEVQRVYLLRSTPLAVTPTSLRLRFACPRIAGRHPLSGQPEERPAPCNGVVTLREATGRRRILGRAEVDRDGPAAERLDIALNARGRRRLGARRPVDVLIATSGKELPPVAWRVRA